MAVCSRDNHTLVTLLPTHKVISIVGNGKYVWSLFSNPFPSILQDVLLVIDWQNLVWIDSYQDGPCVCLKKQREKLRREVPSLHEI